MKISSVARIMQLYGFLFLNIIAFLRLLGIKNQFVTFISCLSFIVTIIIVLHTAELKISKSEDIYPQKRKHYKALLEIISALILIIGLTGFGLYEMFSSIPVVIGDSVTISALGIAISNEYLAERIHIYIQNKTAKVNLDKPA